MKMGKFKSVKIAEILKEFYELKSKNFQIKIL